MMDLTAIIVAALALAGTAYGLWQNRKKPAAEIRSIDTNTYEKQLGMINDLRQELENERTARKLEARELNARIGDLEVEGSKNNVKVAHLEQKLVLAEEAIKYLFDGTVLNIEFMEEQGLDPPFRPKPEFRGKNGDLFSFTE